MVFEEYQRPKKNFSRKEAKIKAADFCAYQERSQQEVRDKLYSYGLHQHDVEEVLSELITENFINEERFAKAYVGGKFRMKSWGRIKIVQGLKQHRISDYCIKKGLQEIDQDDYLASLQKILDKKANTLTNPHTLVSLKKIAAYALQKGYESHLVWSLLKSE